MLPPYSARRTRYAQFLLSTLNFRLSTSFMAWFKRDKKSIEQSTPPEERRVRTEGLWVKCESCRTIVFRKDLEANLFVCPKCQFHFKMNSKHRLEMLLDGRWTAHDAGMTSPDPPTFPYTKPSPTPLTHPTT